MKNKATLLIAIAICFLFSFFSGQTLSIFLTVSTVVFFLYQLVTKLIEYRRVKKGTIYDGRLANVVVTDPDEDGNDRIAIIEYKIDSNTFHIDYRYSHFVKSEPSDLRVYVNPSRPNKPILLEDFYKHFFSTVISSIIFITLAFVIAFIRR